MRFARFGQTALVGRVATALWRPSLPQQPERGEVRRRDGRRRRRRPASLSLSRASHSPVEGDSGGNVGGGDVGGGGGGDDVGGGGGDDVGGGGGGGDDVGGGGGGGLGGVGFVGAGPGGSAKGGVVVGAGRALGSVVAVVEPAGAGTGVGGDAAPAEVSGAGGVVVATVVLDVVVAVVVMLSEPVRTGGRGPFDRVRTNAPRVTPTTTASVKPATSHTRGRPRSLPDATGASRSPGDSGVTTPGSSSSTIIGSGTGTGAVGTSSSSGSNFTPPGTVPKVIATGTGVVGTSS
jgi:hypothetical protein